MRASRGEIKIHEILEANDINFKEEYEFAGLKAPSGRPLRFDFAVFELKNVAAVNVGFFLAVGGGAGEQPLGDAPVAGDEVGGIVPFSVREFFPDCLISGFDRGAAFKCAASGGCARGAVKGAVIVVNHAGHQGVHVVGVPGRGEFVQQGNFVSITHGNLLVERG